MKIAVRLHLCLVLAFTFAITSSSAPALDAPPRDITLQAMGTYASGIFNAGAAEIADYDPKSSRVFVVNLAQNRIDVLDISDPSNPTFIFAIDVSASGHPNSVAVHKGEVAVAVEALVKTDPGRAMFFDTDGAFLSSVEVGSLPDMLTFTPDGKKVLVANEGEPSSYNQANSVDPPGSVSIIDIKHGAARVRQSDVTTAGFSQFQLASLDESIRIFGPNASVAQDLEPEYIAVSHDSKTAWVTLQEANAIGVLDVRDGRFTELIGLGFKDHSATGNALDGCDRDGPGNTPSLKIANWPVLGMYQPDSIATFRYRGQTFLVTADEGDSRDYPGFNEEARVSSLALDATAFPTGAALKTNAQIGRLTVTNTRGNPDNDTDFDQLFVFGTRSFSIRSSSGDLVFNSGDQFEQITAQQLPSFFNSDHAANNSFDTRSDNKGPEPEGVTIGELFGRTYAFVCLERIGGIMIYEITNPFNPRFVQYVNNRNFAGDAAAGTAGDLGPETMIFVPAHDSPNNKPLLIVPNEISGTTTIYQISSVG